MKSAKILAEKYAEKAGICPMLLDGQPIKVTTHFSGAGTCEWALSLIQRHTECGPFEFLSTCDPAREAQIALEQVPGGHKHNFRSLLEFVTKEDSAMISKEVAEERMDEGVGVATAVSNSKLVDKAFCYSCKTLCNCRADIPDLDSSGSICKDWSKANQTTSGKKRLNGPQSRP